VALALLLAVLGTVGVASTRRTSDRPTISYSDFYRDVDDAKVTKVDFVGHEVTGDFTAPQTVGGVSTRTFETTLPVVADATLLAHLRDAGVRVTARDPGQPILVRILLTALPWVLVLGVWVWLSRRASRSVGSVFTELAQGRARRFQRESAVPVRFHDVAGLTAAKRDLQEVVDFLREPQRFGRLGGRVPRGLLLVGPPGTGKTLLARAVAGEANAPFFFVDGSEFIELFVGVGAARVRALFDEARNASPSIVFIDEIDAVGRTRGTGLGGGSDEREQTLNQLLSAMDGFGRHDAIIVMAATNRPDVLDPALLRPGRFDRRVVVDRPEMSARLAILRVHTRDKPLAPDVDLARLAARTPGFSGADLENLVNEAALGATRRRGQAVEYADFLAAYDKVVLGDPRETVLSEEEKRRVAVHEAGHTLVAHFTKEADRMDRVSILPRGLALGATHQIPAGDRHLMTRAEIDARLCVLMGGLSAERLVLGDSSSGAEHDLSAASHLAFEMVAHYGMSETIGPVYHQHRAERPFLGRALAIEGATSDATVHTIELEVRALIAEAGQKAARMLDERRGLLEQLVERLLRVETVEHDELEHLLGAMPPA
jgi:cell division protease FtsH